MISFEGPFVSIFGHAIDDQNTITQIEIPLIQRDYAQGRNTPEVELIRADFLSVLVRAITGGEPVGLDFVYGDVSGGILRPLDGQQRLTTLFLLHWYLATRIGTLDPVLPWTKFKYATRPSAQLFCQRIVEHAAPINTTNLAEWIADQSWFQYLWRHDPSIQSMLTMIGAIEDKCDDSDSFDPRNAWNRLTDATNPAVWFHVLPIDEAGEGDNLYIKMNSRGRPLTRFENFKARFEQTIEGSRRAKDFSEKIDGAWSDMFWPFRDSDHKTDQQFERFFHFITDTLVWRAGGTNSGHLEDRIERLFAPVSDKDGANLDSLITALDAWSKLKDIDAFFTSKFRRPSEDRTDGVLLFGGRQTVNLFKACADGYDSLSNKAQRGFGWAETILLYATQVHIIHETADVTRRLRTLRNLSESSGNELRLVALPKLLTCVESFMRADSYDAALFTLDTFNSAQIEDERDKAKFLSAHPELEATLFDLEDDVVLRGSLVCFELDADSFAARARAFVSVMSHSSNLPAFTGALLASGDYSRIRGNRLIRFGSSSETKWWRDVLTGATRESYVPTVEALAPLLDHLDDRQESTRDALNDFSTQWLADQTAFDWNYYLVKYQIMRSGISGIYAGLNDTMGYQICMLDRTQMNSKYYDPFLSAIAERSNAWSGIVLPLQFTGYENKPRWMQLKKSGTAIRCASDGFVVAKPPAAQDQETLDQILDDFGVGDDLTLKIDQIDEIDTEDRIEKCAEFVSKLIEKGL